MRNHSLGWAANRLLRKQRREARARLAAQLFVIVLSVVGLWASFQRPGNPPPRHPLPPLRLVSML